MKKYIVTSLFVLLPAVSYGQKVNFEPDYDTLLTQLQNEQWAKAFKSCDRLLKYAEPIDSMEIPTELLRYIYIYTTAGQMNEHQLTQQQALARVKGMKGKKVITPAHTFSTEVHANSTMVSGAKRDTLFSNVDNSAGTQIFSFEYAYIKDGVKEPDEELKDKLIAVRGKLEDITVEGHMLPRFRLMIGDAEYRLEQ